MTNQTKILKWWGSLLYHEKEEIRLKYNYPDIGTVMDCGGLESAYFTKEFAEVYWRHEEKPVVIYQKNRYAR